jgi:mRNA-degrading endonuclease RelE of RelBE toxin-antitoxin system
MEPKWQVSFTSKALKQARLLPESVRALLSILVLEMQRKGPVRGNWRNYGRLGTNTHHCHLKRGRPTYVACWSVKDNQVHLLEVYYAGTHEKAPY